MLDETHPAIPRPALLVIVADEVLVVGIGVGGEVALDQITRFLGGEPKHDVNAVNVARVQTDGMASLGRRVAELEEVVGHLGRAGHLAGALETEDEDVEDETVVLL